MIDTRDRNRSSATRIRMRALLCPCFAALALTGAAFAAAAQSASPAAAPFLGEWEGSWVSAMSNQRSGIDIAVLQAEGDMISGKMAFAGGCGGRYDFTANVASGGAVSFGANMRQPCGRVTVNLHWRTAKRQR